MNYRQNIGANIRRERRKRDLTIEGLAEMIDFNPGFLGLIERGKRGTAIDNLCNIADLFGMTLDELVRKTPDELSGDLLAETDTSGGKKNKYSIAANLIKSLSENELDFVIPILKNVNKLSVQGKNLDVENNDDEPVSYN